VHNGYILEEYYIDYPFNRQVTLIRYLSFYDNELNVTNPELLVAYISPDVALIEAVSYVNVLF
jgi:hypothetical protein